MLLRPKRFPLADAVDAVSCRPLFFVSAGRSGTTLLRSMLVAGGEIAIPPETQTVHVAARRFSTLQHLGWADLSRLIIALFESHRNFHIWQVNLNEAYQSVTNMPAAERSLARIVDHIYLAYAHQQFPEATKWGDQSPIHTFYWPWILRVFPRARFIHMVRDGRDAIASMYERGKHLKRGMSLEEATYRWTTSIDRVLALQEHLGEGEVLEVRYEDLVREPEGTLANICAFSGLEFKNEMLEFWRLPSTLEHRYHEYHRNIAKPVFTDSIGKWTERLSPSEQEYVLDASSKWLRLLGYQ
jgi:hypothetical protein